ncbi:unnamed protein product [Spirodela intermedia]|uniref:Uncharacterized protein n=1 Tax=Spirodela intermedia TaxID=51605 RepID=A0ABN7E9M0_SPIIN|nr:unnamed protein product [Spirodela intermedia]
MRINMDKSKPTATPWLVSSLSTNHAGSFDSSVYQSVVAFAVNKACQTMHAPSTQHWVNLKHLLRYLKAASSTVFYSGTAHHQIVSSQEGTSFFGTNLVSWSSKKQPTVARSSTAAEYRAVADTIAELLWIRSLLTELRIPSTSPTTLWCDNVGATYLTANPIFHARTKHVEFDYHFVPQQVLSKHLRVCIISSTDQHANLLTKALPKARFKLLFNKLNLVSRQSLRELLKKKIQVDENRPVRLRMVKSRRYNSQDQFVPAGPPANDPTYLPLEGCNGTLPTGLPIPL